MKKKIIISSILITVCLIAVGLFLLMNREYPDDENTLYSVKFGNIRLRFEHLDYVIPQNQIVAVQKSTNNGKTFETVTEEQVIVSMEPKFAFLNEKFGFAVKKPKNIKDNGKYYGMYVTKDGGKTFNLSEINYDNPNIEILTIKDVPFYENGQLKLHCSTYQVKNDKSGYETVDLYFVTNDDGLTWYLENELTLSVKNGTLTNKGATFILKNNSSVDYCYEQAYYLERKEDNKWNEIILKEPLSWNSVLYTLNKKEEIEINIDWSNTGYGILNEGEYRLVKKNFRKKDSPDSKSYSVYAEFMIK